jgi:hypothetical protein
MSHILHPTQVDAQRKAERAALPDPLTVRFTEAFFDGTLMDAFDKIGQDAHIIATEIRTLPKDLLARVEQSGGKFEIIYT